MTQFEHDIAVTIRSWRSAAAEVKNDHNPKYAEGYTDGIMTMVREMETILARNAELPLLESTGEATGR